MRNNNKGTRDRNLCPRKAALRSLGAALWLLSLVHGHGATPAIKPGSIRGIIFPPTDTYHDSFVDEARTVRGACKTLADCPSAVQRWSDNGTRPQTCYFNKFEHFVCCEESAPLVILPVASPPPPIVRRRSETKCQEFYGFKIQVVNGLPTVPHEFTYMAALGWRSSLDNSYNFLCGGTLISPSFVLTAAHCAAIGGEQPVVVRTGGVNLTDPMGVDVKIKRIIVHPEYDANVAYNDIALVELEEKTRESPACVWSMDDVAYRNVTAIGYGHTQFAGIGSAQLLKTPLFVVPNDICDRAYKPHTEHLARGIQSSQICAGDPYRLRDTCQGDSGGPLIMKVKGDAVYPYVVGITSFGKPCTGKTPSVYTRTSAYIDWIENIVWPIVISIKDRF